jgi:hypothetical protein
MKIIRLLPYTGDFAENKDVARDIRINQILPEIASGREVVLDFQGITAATQSFVHALISELVRKYTDEVYERISFKNCSPSVQQIINIVADYMEDGS